jgi:hypothetical protein
MIEALLRFLFVVVIIYYGFKLIFRYIVPWVIKRVIKKHSDNFNQMNGFSNSDFEKKKEGEVNIKSRNINNPDQDKDFGEYVDFEDVGKE